MMHRRKINIAVLAVIMFSWVFLPAGAMAKDSEDESIALLRRTSQAFTSVAKKALPAVVSVQSETIVSQGPGYEHRSPGYDEFFDRFFGRKFRGQLEERKRVGQGSGFIISKDGYILTNNHVVENADSIKVVLNDGRQFNAKTIGTDPKSDVAVIKIEGDDLPVIELGDSDALEIGEWVIAIGNPFGLSETVIAGIVSAKGRHVGITEGGYEDFIQTDAAINPGNSGGPLLNLDGKAIGINSAIFSQSGGYMGIGFAIPINMATAIKDQLVSSGKVTRGYLGIAMNPGGVTQELAETFGLEKNGGVLISEVVKDSPAEKAGLKLGDIILKIDGKSVEGNIHLRNTIALRSPGTKVKLTVFRDGKEKTITAKVGSLSESEFAAEATGVSKKLGLRVETLTREYADQFGYELGEGVIVTKVENGSIASRGGITPGMLIITIDRREVNNVSDFNDILENADKKKKALFLIRNERFAWWKVLYWD